jgi:hypothetical protein
MQDGQRWIMGTKLQSDRSRELWCAFAQQVTTNNSNVLHI